MLPLLQDEVQRQGDLPAGSLMPKVTIVKSPLRTIATVIAQMADRISLGFETHRCDGRSGPHSERRRRTSSPPAMCVRGLTNDRTAVTEVTCHKEALRVRPMLGHLFCQSLHSPAPPP